MTTAPSTPEQQQTESAPTPGPWWINAQSNTITSDHGFVCDLNGVTAGNANLIVTAPDMLDALSVLMPYAPNPKNMARLIAAAPDLRDALQDILLVARNDDSVLCVARIVDIARAALAKAGVS